MSIGTMLYKDIAERVRRVSKTQRAFLMVMAVVIYPSGADAFSGTGFCPWRRVVWMEYLNKRWS
jgi:hypothetical protein